MLQCSWRSCRWRIAPALQHISYTVCALLGKKPASLKAAPRKKAASLKTKAAPKAKRASPVKEAASDVEVALTDAEQQKSDVETSLEEAGRPETVTYL